MTKHNQINHFELLADKYDYYKKKNNLYFRILKNAIKNQITIKKPTVLDIGCATGTILSFINPFHGIGIDFSNKMIRIAKNKYKYKKSLLFKVHNIEKNSLPGKFDYILFIDVIEHLNDIHSALKNISKMMTKNTSLILSMANPFWEPLMLLMELVKFKMPEGPHNRITESQLICLLNKCHLKIYKKNTYFPNINLPVINKLSLIYVYTIKKSF